MKKDGEIIEKINRLNNKYNKHKKTNHIEIKRISAEIRKINSSIREVEGNKKDYHDEKVVATYESVGLVAVALIAAIISSVFSLKASLIILAIAAPFVLIFTIPFFISRSNEKKCEKALVELNAKLLDAEKRLDKKEHDLENIDKRREKLYKKLDKELNLSKEIVKVRIANKNKKTKNTNLNNEELTK